MCTTCGCSDHTTTHNHDDHHLIQVEKDLLEKNNNYAQMNREYFFEHNILSINFLSSPGSGKTTLLEKTIDQLSQPLCVIEGDQQTSRDADRIGQLGVPVKQINTGKGCHLDAHMIGHAMEALPLSDNGLLFIENVGNLVCPALFDLGENYRVVVLSTTEGEDKPIKYPNMFHSADLMILNKSDLLPHLEFNLDACFDNAKSVNPNIEIITCSALRGHGMQDWFNWLEKKHFPQKKW